MRKLKWLILGALVLVALVWAGYGHQIYELVGGVFALAVIWMIMKFLRI